MDMDKMISRINELAKKKKTEGLNEQELVEQKELYKEYLDIIRGNLTAQLDNVEIIEPDVNNPGTYKTVKEAKNFPKN